MIVSEIGLSDTNGLFCLLNEAAYFDASDYGLLEISGKDAPSYLQSQLTNDIKELAPGQSQFNCLLDRKAHVQSFFRLFRKPTTGDLFYALLTKGEIPALLNHLEQYRFAADVNIVDCSSKGSFFALEGPRVNKIFAFLQNDIYLNEIATKDTCSITYGGINILVFRYTTSGANGYFFWANNNDYATFSHTIKDACAALGFQTVSNGALNTARVENGLAKFGIDFDQNNLLPETGLIEQTVSFTKGCFIGQEVLARVKSHGVAAKALMGLVLSADKPLTDTIAINSPILVAGEEIGILKSNAFSSSSKKQIGLALLKRDYRVPGKEFIASITGQDYHATVTLLPFAKASSNKELARKLYEQAVKEYVQESEGTLPGESITLLKEVLILDPNLDDAYEALAVILSKHNKIEEAIVIMKALALLNPDSVMAHSNLSQFYVLQGLKEAAEEEKAIALGIRMRLAAAEFSNASKQNADIEKEKIDRLKRMEMFEQVLAIDKEDFFANAGMGECLVGQNDFEKAIPYLQKAIELKAIHVAAYIDLAKAYKGSGNAPLAKETINAAIAIASKRGDTKALQNLQSELEAIK